MSPLVIIGSARLITGRLKSFQCLGPGIQSGSLNGNLVDTTNKYLIFSPSPERMSNDEFGKCSRVRDN